MTVYDTLFLFIYAMSFGAISGFAVGAVLYVLKI